MRRVGHLFETITDFHTLCSSAHRAARGKRLSLEAGKFLLNLEVEVLQLQQELLDGTYRPADYRTFTITDPKPRTISAAAFRDRVVHHALCAAIEPRLEHFAIYDSYACREKKGGYAAIKRVQEFARRFSHFLKLDVYKFFETADHAVLKGLLRRLLKDNRTLTLCDRFIDAGAPGSASGKGLPIGNLTSQHFANLYLGPLDHFVKEPLCVRGYCRYMDDHLFFAQGKETLKSIHTAVKGFMEKQLVLELKDSATIMSPVSSGVPYLGFRIWPRTIRLDAYRARRFRALIRRRTKEWQGYEIDEAAWTRSVTSLCGWIEQAGTREYVKSFFERLAKTGNLQS
jgi:RNA-directed DNA polymerase